MKKISSTLILGTMLLAASPAAFAVGDPDFENTKPGELPLWSGAQWVRATTQKFTAKIVADAKNAASGKQYLVAENPGKTSVYVMAYPGLKCIPGYGFDIVCKVRGGGLFNMGAVCYGSDRKARPWRGDTETGFKQIFPNQWQKLKLRYKPIAGDASFMLNFSIRSGRVDVDDVKVSMFKLDDSTPAPAVKKEVTPPPVKKKTAKTISGTAKKNPLVIFSDFENWQNGLPENWKLNNGDRTSIVRQMALQPNEAAHFGSSALYLKGKVLMDPPMKNLAVPRSRPMRLAFYAKGANGKIRARLLEGRNGFVDYIVDLVEENTTPEWKKYASAFALPPGCRIDNAAIELIGENVLIDNLEFKAAQGGDGKLIYHIPVVKTIPVIDGRNTPGEWDFATGASDPLQLAVHNCRRSSKPESPALSQQNTVRFCSDGKKLYFLFEVPEGAGLKRDFVKRDDHIYLDDGVELHINPEFGKDSPRYSYQFIFNANNAVYDQRRVNGGSEVSGKLWNSATLQNRSTLTGGKWTLEGSVDLAEMGLSPEKPFGLNVCAQKRNPDEAGSLNGSEFLELGLMVKAQVSGKAPGIYWEKNGDWGSLLVSVSSPVSTRGKYTLAFELDSEKVKQTVQKEIFLAPGRIVPVLLNVPGGAGKFGSFNLTLKDSAQNTFFRQTMDFNSSIAPAREIQKDLEFHFLPEQKKFAVNIHKRGGWAERVAKVELHGLDDQPIIFLPADFTDFAGTLVVKKPFDFTEGKNCNITLLALDENKVILGYDTKNFTVDSRIMPKDYSNAFPGVLPFYDPIKLSGKEAKVKLRTYTFAGNGLPAKIIANGKEALHNAVTFTAEDAGGRLLKGKNGRFKVLSSNEQKVVFTGETHFPGFTLKLKGTLEYDGAIFYEAKIVAPKPVKVKRLSVEVPMNRLDFFHSFVDSQLRLWMCRQPAKGEYRHPSVKVWTPDTIMYPNDYRRFTLLFFPYGDGVIWNSCNVVPGVLKNGFLPYLTMGNPYFGMELFADTDRGWVHNKKSAIHEILRKNGKEIIRTNFIAMPWTLEKERSFEFGIMATPGKHKNRAFRDGYINGYSHTGLTDQALAGLRVKDWKYYAQQIERFKKSRPIQLCCKGFFPQMDPVAQYMDSDWRTRPDYVFRDSYASVSGRVFGTDQRYYFSPAGCYTPGRVNFYTERFFEFAKNAPALQGFYWDENWMKPCNNPNHAECGYIMPDGQLQGRAWWRAIREVDRRGQHIFRDHGRKDPLFQGFTGEGIIPHAHSFVSINLFGEHFTYDMDYIDYWTPHFTEIAYAGAWGFDVGGFGMFRETKYLNQIHLNRAQFALFKLYDNYFVYDSFNYQLYRRITDIEKRFGKHEKDVIFAGYFMDEGKAILPGLPVEVKASSFIRPGKGALVYISNLGTADHTVKLDFNLKKYNINQFTACNAENGKPVDLSKKISIPKHDFVLIEVKTK